MKKRFSTIETFLMLALAAGIGGLPVSAFADSPTEIVIKREKIMKGMGRHMGAIKAFALEGKGSAADVARRAAEIGAVAAKIPDMFPDGTEMNGAEDSKYRAKPEIWLDWENFEKSAAKLASESKALAAAAGTGDRQVIAAAFTSLGKNGCSGCHKAFRMKVN
jgi:cytochrome c556